MDMRMIMFIIFSVAMAMSFVSKALTTLTSAFAVNKIIQSLVIKVIIICICYFMFF